jgi:cation diffusion facilitator CzcD-associated flavoprotein CzcO
METTNTVIVGGGPAGLATAACLQHRGISSLILEKGDVVAPAWHRHYERLHLHTNKGVSGLPYHPMPGHFPKFPSRDHVAGYLADYARKTEAEIRLGTEVRRCSPNGAGWVVETVAGASIHGQNLVVATGLSHFPNMPTYEGMDSFRGQIIHSSEYLNGEPFRNRDVLVVGFGNSAGEIALDALEHGGRPRISVRSPVNAVPRDIAGIPILTISRFLSVLPPRVGDVLSKPLLSILIGDLSRYGLPVAEIGPLEQMAVSAKVPLLDIGTVAAIKEGSLPVRPGIAAFAEDGVEFTDGRWEEYDAVVFGTGYRPALDRILDDLDGLVDPGGLPLVSGGETAIPGLFFCGFHEPATGRLREIGIEARRLADIIATRVG